MSSLLDKQIVLRLNANWQAVGFCSVRQAIVFLCSESAGQHPGYAMDYQTIEREGGEILLQYANPVSWEDWIELPVREGDLAITTARGQIRCPLTIVCAHYSKIPHRTPRVSSGTIYERDKGVCQYTGEYVGRSGGNLDHVNPRDRGGPDSFENLVWCKKSVNTMKANRLPHEAGLKLRAKPKAPPSMPVIITVDEAKHPTQKPFLLR